MRVKTSWKIKVARRKAKKAIPNSLKPGKKATASSSAVEVDIVGVAMRADVVHEERANVRL